MLTGTVTAADRLVLDIDQVLLDTHASFYAAAKQVVGEHGGELDDDGISAFKSAGGFNDDWHLTRAAITVSRWQRRTGDTTPLAQLLVPNAGVGSFIGRTDDPGDVSDRCMAVYRTVAHTETVLVDLSLLHALMDAGVSLCACTGRNREEMDLANARLGIRFDAVRTSEDARKPDPHALLPLLDVGRAWFIGDSIDDQNCAVAARPLTDCRLSFARVVTQVTDVPGADVVTVGVNPFLRALLEATHA
jgi:HAD superfamily phosphatase